MCITIAIANQKGGVGKTTTAVELASILAEQKRKVLAIDLDQQCNLTKHSGASKEKPTIYDLFVSDNPNLKSAIQKTQDKYHVIAGSPAMSKADKDFDDTPDTYLLKDLIEAVSDKYDYIIIDNGPARNKLLNMSYLAADYFIMCIDSAEDSVDGIDAIVADMMKYHKPGKQALSEAKILGVIMTRYRNTSIGNAILEIMKNKLTNELPKEILTNEVPFIMTVREAAVVDEAKLFHQSLQQYKRWSNPAMDYRKIAAQIIMRVEHKNNNG